MWFLALGRGDPPTWGGWSQVSPRAGLLQSTWVLLLPLPALSTPNTHLWLLRAPNTTSAQVTGPRLQGLPCGSLRLGFEFPLSFPSPPACALFLWPLKPGGLCRAGRKLGSVMRGPQGPGQCRMRSPGVGGRAPALRTREGLQAWISTATNLPVHPSSHESSHATSINTATGRIITSPYLGMGLYRGAPAMMRSLGWV